MPRVRSTLWHPSSYASILLVLFAIQWFQVRRYPGKIRIVRLGALLLLAFNLFFTLSRTTYVAFAVMLFFLWWLDARTYKSRLQKLLLLTLIAGAILAYLLLTFLLSASISMDWLENALYEFRPYSFTTRAQVYEASWQLVRQKPFWGWGTLIKIEDLPSAFSAGSHSDYLSVVFQYGIPGLLLYLGFLISVLWAMWKGYMASRQSEIKRFFGIVVALMLAMALRQATSELLWDVYVVSTFWATLALGLALLPIARSGKGLG